MSVSLLSLMHIHSFDSLVCMSLVDCCYYLALEDTNTDILCAETISFACKQGSPPERLWNISMEEAPQLSKLALHLMSVSVNSAGCERAFSQMGLTHTKLRNRLGHAKTTHIVQVRQELHRDRPARKKSQVVDPLHSGNNGQQAAEPAASSAETRSAAASTSEQDIPVGEDQLYDLDAFTSGSEFRLTVNEWLADLDAEDAQASQVSAYADSPAILKAPLSQIFGSALLPLLDDQSAASY